MPTTLTLKNIPEEIYSWLKSSAEFNKRSIDSEALICLRTALAARHSTTDQQLDRAKTLREQIAVTFLAEEHDALKREGRA